jgi:hypothetical protein
MYYAKRSKNTGGRTIAKTLNFSKTILLYQDKPEYGLLLKLILLIPVAFLAVSIIYGYQESLQVV